MNPMAQPAAAPSQPSGVPSGCADRATPRAWPFGPKPAVVAVHETALAAQAAVDVLTGAGYHARMLRVVGRQYTGAGPARDTSHIGKRWASSGTFWGLLLPVLLVTATYALPEVARSPAPVFLIAILIILLQAALATAAVAPRPFAAAAWCGPSVAHRAWEDQLAAGKLLLVVVGTRSEIALAGSLLQRA